MGRYFIVVNVDKEQYIDPHQFGDGVKLMEFGNSSCGTLTGLAVLLADGNNRGGGDLRSDLPIIGSWAGDRIVIAGDYADGGKFVEGVSRDTLQAIADECFADGYQDPERVTLYNLARAKFDDVSNLVIRAVADGEGDRHPLAHVDTKSTGWRERPSWEDANEQAREREQANSD